MCINLLKIENVKSRLMTDGQSGSQTVSKKMNLNVVWRSSSHREVNTFHLCYKNQSVDAVWENNHCCSEIRKNHTNTVLWLGCRIFVCMNLVVYTTLKGLISWSVFPTSVFFSSHVIRHRILKYSCDSCSFVRVCQSPRLSCYSVF
jgi:hypothetical protein